MSSEPTDESRVFVARLEIKQVNYRDKLPSLKELRRVIPMTFRLSSLHNDPVLARSC